MSAASSSITEVDRDAGSAPDWTRSPWRDLLDGEPTTGRSPRILEAFASGTTEAGAAASADAQAQERHYDAVATAYLRNLDEPQVRTYQAHLDEVLERAIAETGSSTDLGTLLELCCGHAEGLAMMAPRMERGVGVDVSVRMLDAALNRLEDAPVAFIHGDATRVPLRDGSVDTVLLLGGIHHVNDRAGLYREIARVLRPGGRLVFREPLDDLWLWRALRWIVYRVSPNLDAATERPLRRTETIAQIESAELHQACWRPAGLFGFCLFMNTDVLIVNRLFRYVPGIRSIVRAVARVDAALLRLPGLRNAGLQVVGVAVKPEQSS